MKRTAVAAAALAVIGITNWAAPPPAAAGTNYGRVVADPRSTSGASVYDGWTFYNSPGGKPVGSPIYVGPSPIKNRSSYPRMKDADGVCFAAGKTTTVVISSVTTPDEVIGSRTYRGGCHKVEGLHLWEFRTR